MDFFDFLAASAGEGGRRVRWIGALVGALVGGGLAWLYATDVAAGDPSGVTYGVIGALVGGCLGALFAFAIVWGTVAIVVIVGFVVIQSLVTG